MTAWDSSGPLPRVPNVGDKVTLLDARTTTYTDGGIDTSTGTVVTVSTSIPLDLPTCTDIYVPFLYSQSIHQQYVHVQYFINLFLNNTQTIYSLSRFSHMLLGI